MKRVSVDDFKSNPDLQEEAARILREEGGLICFPCVATYRFGVNLLSERGVMQLLQTKRRSGHRPALVMVNDAEMVARVVKAIPAPAQELIQALWPGHLTLRLPLSKELPRKVYKDLSKPDGKVGVRIPQSPIARTLVQAAGVPLLVSSANRSKKAGADSLASVLQQFARHISLFIEAGDLATHPPSTIVDFDKAGQWKLVRAGSVSEESIRKASGA